MKLADVLVWSDLKKTSQPGLADPRNALLKLEILLNQAVCVWEARVAMQNETPAVRQVNLAWGTRGMLEI